MDNGVECTLSNFTNDTKLCGAVTELEGRDAIQRNFKMLERRADGNIMKLNKEKYKTLAKETALSNHPGATLEVTLAPPELGLKLLLNYIPHSHTVRSDFLTDSVS
ncbi:hypothetical protein BTVI_62581 [Pitangus sulphuratus]|nr:hypothetical protein BTVI_62581 [Pitangus sulphuratus]